MSSESRRELALMVAAATVLGVVDSMLPRPLPFLRLGLANIPAVITVHRSGLRATLELNSVRVVAVALVAGTLATPTFFLSLSGALASALVMTGILRLLGKHVSVPAVSASGAAASLWAQLFAATFILKDIPVAGILPAVSLWGTISGAVTGIAAAAVMKKMPETEALRMV